MVVEVVDIRLSASGEAIIKRGAALDFVERRGEGIFGGFMLLPFLGEETTARTDIPVYFPQAPIADNVTITVTFGDWRDNRLVVRQSKPGRVHGALWLVRPLRGAAITGVRLLEPGRQSIVRFAVDAARCARTAAILIYGGRVRVAIAPAIECELERDQTEGAKVCERRQRVPSQIARR